MKMATVAIIAYHDMESWLITLQLSSTGINHNIDELLVGVYSQIQLRRAAPASRSPGSARTKVNTIILLRTGFRVLTKVKSA